MQINENGKILMTFELEKVEEYTLPLFENLLKYVNTDVYTYSGQTLDISYQVGFFDDDRIAAYADVVSGVNKQYKVKVNMASWFVIYSYCHCVVIQQEFYKMMTFGENYDENKASHMADWLTAIMFSTLIFHEIGHICNGHIDYIKKKEEEYLDKNPDSKIIEKNQFSFEGKKARPFISPEMWQSLEWNADDFSVTRLVGLYTHENNIDKSLMKGKEHSFSYLVVGIISLFSLMEMGYLKEIAEVYTEKEHLPKRIRVEKCIESLVGSYKMLNKESLSMDVAQIKKVFIPQIEHISELFMQTYFIGYDAINLNINNNSEELDEEHMNYYNKVDECYSINLHSELKEYSYLQVCDDDTLMRGAILEMIKSTYQAE